MGKFIAAALVAVFLTGAKVNTVNMQQLQHAVIKPGNDTLFVVNFWATWCKPCVTELPYFENANAQFAAQKAKVVFVSLNSVKEMPQVESFVAQKQIKADVMLLNAGNPNNWIDTVDMSWSGAIPCTAMYRNGKKVFFYEGEFTRNQLDSIIKIKTKQL